MILIFSYAFGGTYEKFEYDEDLGCEKYFEKCLCLGSLSILDSYPPQFLCGGINFCWDINRVECYES